MWDFFFFFKQAKNVFKGDLCWKKRELGKSGDNHKGKASKIGVFQYLFHRKKLINQKSNV